MSSTLVHRLLGNTNVKRKNVIGYNVIAEATKSTGAAIMAIQMKGIVDVCLEVEQSKIEVHIH